MTAPHEATEDTVVAGYKIKSKQIIVCDLLQPRFDEEEWTNPQEFSPERFTNSSSDLTDRPAYSVFGLGKICSQGMGWHPESVCLKGL